MRSLYIVVLFRFFWFIIGSATGNNNCSDPGNWSLYEGQCYSCKSDKVSWQSARSSCLQLGGNLVTISNSGIQTFLLNLCGTTSSLYWIGLNDISNEGDFVWDGTSTPFSYSNWWPGEPNDSGGDDCIFISAGNQWFDHNCDVNLSFICQRVSDIGECVSSPCVHGTCTDQLNSYTCQCQPGYTGTNCDIDFNECSSSPCVHGTCINQVNSYTCQCQPGYIGTNCDEDVDECQSSPCIHGVCSNLINAYSCQCYPGYEETQCQIDINECLSSPCQHGTCIDKIDSYSCNCSPGYIGRACDTDVDECQSSPCIHGNCSDHVNEYRCQCFPGYEGLQCQIDIDECLSSPCRQGTCIDKINSYMCHCSPGYTGVHCETDVNECLSSPCGHGSCIDKVNSFVCECTFGYKGISCDEFNTLLLLVLLTFLPIIMLIFSFYLSKRIKHNKVEDVAIFVFPDISIGESKPKLVFQK
ncbi:fibropellin-1-like isoform X2 [Crassostrea angulata]|uniref:fibropellin-1-like isoform X2 n=1 Tax=Magallana angulata TaxID=2784310 RepID=UPI0022B125B4|nr:fibropellin-1-like isoform X2 [Crassostrea angulata]